MVAHVAPSKSQFMPSAQGSHLKVYFSVVELSGTGSCGTHTSTVLFAKTVLAVPLVTTVSLTLRTRSTLVALNSVILPGRAAPEALQHNAAQEKEKPGERKTRLEVNHRLFFLVHDTDQGHEFEACGRTSPG